LSCGLDTGMTSTRFLRGTGRQIEFDQGIKFYRSPLIAALNSL